MKNWLPLVLAPELAMATEPSGYWGVGRLGQLVGELVAGPTGSVAGGVAGLVHEGRDDPVEDDAVEEVLVGQEDEAVDRLGCRLGSSWMVNGPMSVVTVAV